MNWLSNEVLFYGGIIIVAICILALIICLFIFQLKMSKVNLQLHVEYGEKQTEKSQRLKNRVIVKGKNNVRNYSLHV